MTEPKQYQSNYLFTNWKITGHEQLVTIQDVDRLSSLTVNPHEFLLLRSLIRDLTNLVENNPDINDFELSSDKFLVGYQKNSGEVFVTIAGQMSKPGADQHMYSDPITCSCPELRTIFTLLIEVSNWRIIHV